MHPSLPSDLPVPSFSNLFMVHFFHSFSRSILTSTYWQDSWPPVPITAMPWPVRRLLGRVGIQFQEISGRRAVDGLYVRVGWTAAPLFWWKESGLPSLCTRWDIYFISFSYTIISVLTLTNCHICFIILIFFLSDYLSRAPFLQWPYFFFYHLNSLS